VNPKQTSSRPPGSRADGELWLGHYSLRHVSADQRWPAAAAAGFTGISTAYTEILQLRQAGISAASLKGRADSLGLRLTELEYFNLLPSQSRADALAVATDMAETAAELGCANVTSVAKSDTGFVGSSPGGGVLTEIARNFGVLADACARVGLGCVVEFMPHETPLDTLARARDLLRAVQRDNAGLTIDAIHFFRAGPDWPGLQALPASDVYTVQLSDGPSTPRPGRYLTESLEFRLCPGLGEFDLPRFLSALRGFQGPLTVEVLSGALSALPPGEAALIMADSARKILASATD
jgi:sugar phosphate isomerase/epimerase